MMTLSERGSEQQLLEDASVSYYDTPAAAIIAVEEQEGLLRAVSPAGEQVVAQWHIIEALMDRYGYAFA